MAEIIGAINEIWFFGVDCKLDLSDYEIIVFHVDEDVICGVS